MDERLQFVSRRLAGEPMAELCREFGISRKTGYKIFDRYQDCVHSCRIWAKLRCAGVLPLAEKPSVNVRPEFLNALCKGV